MAMVDAGVALKAVFFVGVRGTAVYCQRTPSNITMKL